MITHRDKQVIKAILDGDTAQEVGEEFLITRERVLVIVKTAWSKVSPKIKSEDIKHGKTGVFFHRENKEQFLIALGIE